MSKYKFNNGYIYRNGFRVPMPCVVVVLNEMQQKLEAYSKEQEKPHFKATRENLEKIAKDAQGVFVEVREKEGEKWTHTRELDSERCYLLSERADKDGHLPVFVENVGYDVEFGFKLKPIKPTIKPSAAWSLVSKQGWPIHQVTETYDVEEVPAND